MSVAVISLKAKEGAVWRPLLFIEARKRSKLLDHRSRYGQFWFPEGLRAPEVDVDREVRFDWTHAEQPGTSINQVTAELGAMI